MYVSQKHLNFSVGIPVTKHRRATLPAPNLESISLSQAQIANPEMLFKVNNTAKYVRMRAYTHTLNYFKKTFSFLLDTYVLN